MAKKRILMISSDPSVCELIQHSLEGYSIDIFYTTGVFKPHSRIPKNGYCLTIMDIQPSAIREIEMLCSIRDMSYTPILVLTEDCSTEKQVAFLQMGADVCVGKPVNIDLCIAQVEALIRLYHNAKISDKSSLVFGDGFVISPCYRKVYINGKELSLTRKEFNILLFFAQHPKQVFSIEQLYEHIWNMNFAVSGDETVRAHIKTLRKKLTQAGKNYIYNVWGIGYKFVPPDDEGYTET